MGSKRISMSLFDDELKALINASAKIFPITQLMVDTSLNPDGYEYGKIERSIYRWNTTTLEWEYIVADDIEIAWNDVSGKPTVFPPETHGHTELHTHGNKSLIDSITQMMLDAWNTVTGKAELVHTHVESDITNLDKYTTAEINALLLNKAGIVHNHDDAYYTIDEVVALLAGKSDTTHDHATLYSALAHDHDGRYFTESEVSALLSGKENTLANRAVLLKITESIANESYDLDMLYDLDDRLYMIENGYTEGHTHSDITLLESITQFLVDGWNSAVTHISDAVKHITSAERTLWNTISTHVHDTLYAPLVHGHVKAEITDLSLGWTDITDKPLVYPPDTHTHPYAEVTHAHDDRYYTESEINTQMASKADATTLSGHTSNTTVHVTQADKDAWNAGGNFATIGTVKPTDGSMWYQEIV